MGWASGGELADKIEDIFKRAEDRFTPEERETMGRELAAAYGCGNPDHHRRNVVLPCRADQFAATVLKRWRCPTEIRASDEKGEKVRVCGDAVMILGIEEEG